MLTSETMAIALPKGRRGARRDCCEQVLLALRDLNAHDPNRHFPIGQLADDLGLAHVEVARAARHLASQGLIDHLTSAHGSTYARLTVLGTVHAEILTSDPGRHALGTRDSHADARARGTVAADGDARTRVGTEAVPDLTVSADVVAWQLDPPYDAHDWSRQMLAFTSGKIRIELELPRDGCLALAEAIEGALRGADWAARVEAPVPTPSSAVAVCLSPPPAASGSIDRPGDDRWTCLFADASGWQTTFRLRRADVGALLHQLRTWAFAHTLLENPEIDDAPRAAALALMDEYAPLTAAQALRFMEVVAELSPRPASDLECWCDLIAAAADDPAE